MKMVCGSLVYAALTP
ncbi:hypothetical protein LOR95_21660 [Vibrio vulnificus]|nr:hypothetical protein [Vibrio vulnificus]MCG8706674.1 hypothetical protein [Vibrio vulnificus]